MRTVFPISEVWMFISIKTASFMRNEIEVSDRGMGELKRGPTTPFCSLILRSFRAWKLHKVFVLNKISLKETLIAAL